MDDGLSYVPGSSNLFEPSVKGQVLVWSDVTQGAGLAPRQRVRVTFLAEVPSEVGQYVNTATAEGVHTTGSVFDTDDVVLAVEDPSVRVTKHVMPPGFTNGVITFTITITNTGPSVLEVLPIVDHFSGPIEYLGGSPFADMVDNVEQVIGWNDLTTTYGDMQPGAVYRIETVFRLTDETSEEDVHNTATVSGATDRFGNTARDASYATVTSIPGPSAIELLSFTATRRSDGIAVRWRTGLELDTWGFLLWRSSDGRRASAEQVTTELIPSRGRSTGGATYAWTDAAVKEGTTYTYWLQEIEVDGSVHEYGPATTTQLSSGQRQVFLPLVVR
ncbi:MAG: hypothetical protein HC884_04040 [Chloroflexaceae bacterium]|nr:hypothetical protein [Chloroflexaceae bacterium]